MRLQTKLFLNLVLILLSKGLFCQTTDKDAKNYSTLSSDILTILKDTKVVGVSVAIIDNYKVTWAQGFGLKEVGAKDSVTAETIFQAASITKSVVALAIMREFQDGKVSLNEDVNTYLQEWKIPTNEYTKKSSITLKQLLSHTSGISNTTFPSYDPDERIPTAVQALNGVSPARNEEVTVASYPGKMFAYSNSGYALVQQILTDTEKRGFEEIMYDKIFSQLEMTYSNFNYHLPNGKFKSVASGHLKGNEVIKCKYYVLQPMAFGSLWSTPTDLANFLIEIQLSLVGKSNKILNQENTRLMLKPVSNSSGGQYSLGFEIEKRGTGVTFFGHDGHNYGYISSMLGSLEGGFGVVIMTNSENGWKAVNKIKKLVGRKYWGF